MTHSLKLLPPSVELDTKNILLQLKKSHKALAELKGYADTIPNKNILINAITINEAKDSSAIENIITTHDELFKGMSNESIATPEAKKVINYRTAVWRGYELIKNNGFISTNMIIEIQQLIESNRAGLRKLPGTVLINDATGEVVYVPPSGEEEIKDLMKNLENYVNANDEVDDLVKLAIMHYQFESIHPFYDGNGRTGRILNVLFLVLKNLLDSPILYLSKYIINSKSDYYKLLSNVTKDEKWEDWILYILKGIEITAIDTLELVKTIISLNADITEKIRVILPKIYSKELIDLLFFEFYTKINYIEVGLGVTRKTAAKYLNELEEYGLLTSEKLGRDKVYLNKALLDLVKNYGD